MPPGTQSSAGETAGFMDDAASEWTVSGISDGKLLALHSTIQRIRRLGGPFAEVNLSEHALAKLTRKLRQEASAQVDIRITPDGKHPPLPMDRLGAKAQTPGDS